MGDSLPESFFLLWAKLARGPAGEPTFHPLICHLLDVAAVARAMWDHVLSPRMRAWLAEALALDEDTARRWIAFLAGIHDLGKASPGFQLQDDAPPVLKDRLRAYGLWFSAPLPHPPAHGLVTAKALPPLLELELKLAAPVASRLGTIVGGHHGIFPCSKDLSALTPQAIGTGPWADVRLALVKTLVEAVGVSRTAVPQRLDHPIALALAGLVSVADWIGSVAEYFPYAGTEAVASSPSSMLRTYLPCTAEHALRALDHLGWRALPLSDGPRPFGMLFPGMPSARPVQKAVALLADQLSPPFLVILEAPTGEGKTEAALYLSDYAAAVHGQRGFYFALPTQATSNQMFKRVGDFLNRRYPTALINLQLLHGHAALSAEFELLRQRADALLQPEGIAQDPDVTTTEAGVMAAGWFTHRKRGLLAPFGVGTVDQALLAVLQTRHGFVRLWGLAGKVVIVDEVHAYDTYMTTLLERLLEWLAALGTSVILLSATLPRGRLYRLLGAYAHGLGYSTPVLKLPPYPRLSWVTSAGADASPLQPATSSVRTVRVKWVEGTIPADHHAPFPLGADLKTALADGGCAVVICNTVARAQEVYWRLRPYFGTVGPDGCFTPELADDGQPVLDLLHARFLFKDREVREKRVLQRFGKAGSVVTVAPGKERLVRRPNRAVLVATQVVEQSLDLDFDLLVTDVAPVDLIFQRIGRLHRHERRRPPGLAMPTVWICRPALDAAGVPQFGRGDEHVYDPHVLFRSWLVLRDRSALDVPADIEPLVEEVYDDRPCPSGLPEALRRYWEVTREQILQAVKEERGEARARWIRGPASSDALWHFTENPREDDAPELHQAYQALTRLSEPTVAVVCLYGTAEHPTFDRRGREPVLHGAPDLARRLLERSVALTDRRVVSVLLDQEPPAAWQMSALLRHHRLLILNEDDRVQIGQYWLRLHPELGIVISDEPRGSR
ncbi:MAG: CRISPR-associated helicase Cas3' [Chloroflexi bacterium]|nr:CRISPR-associated helicase Cas3' [Chloroflexota bacterium]